MRQVIYIDTDAGTSPVLGAAKNLTNVAMNGDGAANFRNDRTVVLQKAINKLFEGI